MRSLLALVAVALTASPAHASEGPYDRATLVGLTGVYVNVELFSEQAKRVGFDRRTFQSDVESKLRTAGIKVLSESEMFETSGMPTLDLVVTPLHDRRGEAAAFSLVLQMSQFLILKRDQILERDQTLERDLPTSRRAVKWSTFFSGVGDVAYVRESVKDRVDMFIDAWHLANPEPQESAP